MPELKIDKNTTGDTIVIPVNVGKKTFVSGIFVTADANVHIKFKSGDLDLTGPIPITANGCFFTPRDNQTWFTVGEKPFVLWQDGTAQLSGRVYYTQG